MTVEEKWTDLYPGFAEALERDQAFLKLLASGKLPLPVTPDLYRDHYEGGLLQAEEDGEIIAAAYEAELKRLESAQ